MSRYDIVFIGHMCWDEILPFRGDKTVSAGSAVLCGATAAARIGKKVAVVTKMSTTDDSMLDPMRACGIDVTVIPAAKTTYMRVIHPSEDPDERILVQRGNAGFFRAEEIPELDASSVHLAGVSDREFDLRFIRAMSDRGYRLSCDMQDFVRHVEAGSGKISFEDYPGVREIAALMEKIKLDAVEAEVLTGTRDLERAAEAVASWGCPEVVITSAEGVFARADDKSHFEKFTNDCQVGRTGRGDTTFAGYLSWRLDHNVPDSLKFASALVSIKMEKPGPFSGSLEDVLARIAGHRPRIRV
jgi:sugar/nucleoside kinase (ribokinase family)